MHEERNGQDRKNRIPVIGLTGGIGTGKSTVAEYLKKVNYAHVDADQIGRDLTADGSELLPVLDQVFGPAGELGEPGKPILREDGSLDRKALGAIAFSAQEKKEKLDEISACGPTVVCEIKDGGFTSYEITPEQFGYAAGKPEELTGGTPQENAEITKAILNGTEKGTRRNAVCMNAGAALYIAGKTETLEEGVRMAEQLIDSGAAMKKLEEFIAKSNA